MTDLIPQNEITTIINITVKINNGNHIRNIRSHTTKTTTRTKASIMITTRAIIMITKNTNTSSKRRITSLQNITKSLKKISKSLKHHTIITIIKNLIRNTLIMITKKDTKYLMRNTNLLYI